MELITRSLSEVSSLPISWLWHGRVPRGKVTMLAGDPGLGKSFVTLDLAARITVNAAMPDAPVSSRGPGSVLVLSAEDDAGDTIRPRIERAGGDPSRIVIVDGIRKADAPGSETGDGVRLDINMGAIERQLERMDRPRLVIIDPISAYLGEVDGHSNAQVRGLLSGLSRLAAKHGPAVVCVTHLNKSGAGKAVYRMMGSLAFTAAARIAWLISKDPDDSDRRLMVLMKSNLDAVRTGLAFRVVEGRVEWEGTPVQMDASSLEDEGAAPAMRTRIEKADDACTLIHDLLSGGARRATDVLAAAAAGGFSEGAARRAKQRLGIESVRMPGSEAGSAGVWMWQLPGAAEQSAAAMR